MKNSSTSTTDKTSHNANQHSSGFFYREDVIRWILRIFYACCAGLFIIDFFIHRHTQVDFEKIPGFYAIYGLVACVILVLIAKWIRIFLIRKENYYDETEEPEDYLQKQDLELPQSFRSHDSPTSSLENDQGGNQA